VGDNILRRYGCTLEAEKRLAVMIRVLDVADGEYERSCTGGPHSGMNQPQITECMAVAVRTIMTILSQEYQR